MLIVNVKHDIKKLVKGLDRKQKRDLPKAVNQALNRTATQTQGTAVKSISKETGIKQKDVRATFKIRKSNWRHLVASITTHGRMLNIIRFGARQTKKGVSAAPWRKRRVFPGTFIANQGRTVFKRKGKARLPIVPIHGPSIPRELVRNATEKAWRKTIKVRFPINLTQAMNRFFGRK